MSMFDSLGQPTGGYGQNSPFKDNPKPPGQVPLPNPPGDGAGSGTPSVPTDPTLSGWRQPNSSRQLGQPHAQMGITDGSASPLNRAILGGATLPRDQGTGSITAPFTPSTGGGYSPGDPPPFVTPMSPQGPQVNLQMPAGVHPGYGVPQGQSASPAATGNPEADWHSFINASGVDGAYVRQHMPELVAQFDQQTGNKFTAGNPNAKGESDTVMVPGTGSVDVVHGGDNNLNQWYVEGQGGAGAAGALGGVNPMSIDNSGLGQTGSNNPLMQAILSKLQQSPNVSSAPQGDDLQSQQAIAQLQQRAQGQAMEANGYLNKPGAR